MECRQEGSAFCLLGTVLASILFVRPGATNKWKAKTFPFKRLRPVFVFFENEKKGGQIGDARRARTAAPSHWPLCATFPPTASRRHRARCARNFPTVSRRHRPRCATCPPRDSRHRRPRCAKRFPTVSRHHWPRCAKRFPTHSRHHRPRCTTCPPTDSRLQDVYPRYVCGSTPGRFVANART